MKKEDEDLKLKGQDPRLDAFWLLVVFSMLVFNEPSGESLWGFLPNLIGLLSLFLLVKLVRSHWFQELFSNLEE